MKLWLIVAGFILLNGCSGGSSSPTLSPVITMPVPIIENHQVMYFSVAEPVTYNDVVSLAFELPSERLSYGNDNLQFAEYWAPATVNEQQNLPVVVFLHGGCWSNQFRIDHSYAFATALSLNGFPVWSVEYRATGDVGGAWPGTYNDIEAALQLIENKRMALFNQRKLIVIGHSAGGHLALLASSNMTLGFDTIGLAAIVNMTDYANSNSTCSGAAASFMNGQPSSIPNQYTLANPDLATLTGSAYLFVGGGDFIVPMSQAINSGLNYSLYAPAGHFDWIHPGTNTFSELLAYLLVQ